MVEVVGEELMGLATEGKGVPDTPRTVIDKMKWAEKADDDGTIVLDDSQEDDKDSTKSSSPDSVIFLDQVQPTPIQEIASQYYNPPADFIPLTRSDWIPPKVRPAATKDRYKQRRKSLRPPGGHLYSSMSSYQTTSTLVPRSLHEGRCSASKDGRMSSSVFLVLLPIRMPSTRPRKSPWKDCDRSSLTAPTLPMPT